MEQQRHLSATGNPIFGMRLVPYLMANFAVASRTTTASTTINDESLESVAVVGGFLHGLGRWSDEYQIWAFPDDAACSALP
jgi:hypothetical protein